MTTMIFHHPDCEKHDTGFDHPESAARLRALLDELAGPDFARLVWRLAPKAERGQILRAHDREHMDHVFASLPKSGRVDFEPGGTVVSPMSGEAALRAAGAVCAAVDAVMKGEVDNAFCAVRPPGHHAERSRGMGFCLFNNVAIGALHGKIAHGLERIAVIDIDVHHGNGTQYVLQDHAEMFFASTHQSFLFPNTGHANEATPSNVVNVQLARDGKGDRFRSLFSERIMPELMAFRPQLVLVSAGFDADRRDPVGGLNWDPDDFAWVTRELAAAAAECADGRLVSVLEGGYSPRAVATSGAAHVRILMERGR